MTLYGLARPHFNQPPKGADQWVDIDFNWVGDSVILTGTDDEQTVFVISMHEARFHQEVTQMTERRQREEETRNEA